MLPAYSVNQSIVNYVTLERFVANIKEYLKQAGNPLPANFFYFSLKQHFILPQIDFY